MKKEKDNDDNKKKDFWTEKMLHDPETASKVSHEVMRPSAPETSRVTMINPYSTWTMKAISRRRRCGALTVSGEQSSRTIWKQLLKKLKDSSQAQVTKS